MTENEELQAVKDEINKLNRLVLDFYDREKEDEKCNKEIEKILKKIYKVLIGVFVLIVLSFG